MEGAFITNANSYQTAVLDFVRHGSGHGIVEATAGSGKTTTLVMVAQLLVSEMLQQGSRACFLAFNRSTAAELRTRLPTRVESQTIHSLGRQILADSRTGNVELEPAKYRRIALELLRGEARGVPTAVAAPVADDAPELAAHLEALFGFARLELTDLTDISALTSLCRRFDLPAPRPPAKLAALYSLLPAIHEAGRMSPSVDFTDMLYLPSRLSLPIPRFAFLCVDEAQDLSPLALGLVLKLIEAGARALFVGDPYQAIYEFAGADAHSLRRIEELAAATRLPLSVSFRCPIRHVVLARRFSPDMKAAAGAPSGAVRLLSASSLANVAAAGDLIMARNNAPLPALALEIAASGKPVRILGHDLVSPAKELAAALFGRDPTVSSPVTPEPTDPDQAAPGETPDYRGKDYLAGETVLGRDCEAHLERSADQERIRLENEYLTRDQLPEELERSRLTHATLKLALRTLFVDRSPRTLGALSATLERLFDPEHGHVLLATIHKAKGREATRTFLLHPELLGVTEPTGEGSQGDSAAQSEDRSLAEANVLFVALTRAKHELFLVQAEPGAIAARLEATYADRATSRNFVAATTEAASDNHAARPTHTAELAGSNNAIGKQQAFDLGKHWTDVLRLAVIMSGVAEKRGLSSRHGQARGVQERWWQVGSGRRRTSRRRDHQGGDNR